MNGLKLYVRDNCVKMNIVDLFLWCIFCLIIKIRDIMAHLSVSYASIKQII